jgi:hypothetical protein
MAGASRTSFSSRTRKANTQVSQSKVASTPKTIACFTRRGQFKIDFLKFTDLKT